MNIFFTLITQPITNALVAIYQLLHSLGVPYAPGFSIILLTIIIRLLLYPLIGQQLRASKKMQEIQPHINRLKEKHKNDPKRLQQETMQLYKDQGVNPIAGCLPLLIQLPIIWGLYSVLNQTVRQTSYEAINKMLYTDNLKLHTLWDTKFFGFPLGQDPSTLMKVYGPVMLLVPVLTGALQFYQSRQMMASKPATPETAPKDNDFAAALQKQQLYIFPIMIGFFSYTLPLGLSLYWNTFSIFGIIQQYIMNRQAKSTVLVPALPEVKKPVSKKRK